MHPSYTSTPVAEALIRLSALLRPERDVVVRIVGPDGAEIQRIEVPELPRHVVVWFQARWLAGWPVRAFRRLLSGLGVRP